MTPLFKLQSSNCMCVMMWVTRKTNNIGAAEYAIAQVIDWTKCKEHNPELKDEADASIE